MNERQKYYMKLKSLHVENLYGAYEYHVDFNSDVTFVFGTNGCGKTTILNITEAIITGMLFKLFQYKFSMIKLQYYKIKNENEVKEIVITQDKPKLLSIIYEERSYSLNYINLDSDQRRANDVREITQVYFNKYEILKKIHNSFNYVYLPLNRSMNFDNSIDIFDGDMNYRILNRRFNYHFFDELEEGLAFSNKDYNISQIENLIYYKYNSASAEVRKIENDFRSIVLQSLLNVSYSSSVEDVIKSMSVTDILKITPNKISDVKRQYIGILRDLTSTDVDIHNCEEFFKSFQQDLEESKKDRISVDFLFRYKDFQRIQSTIALAEQTRKAKERVMSTFQRFTETMNSFISQTEKGKEIAISQEGKIGFFTEYSRNMISVQHLSSGEKQLLIFFANLIFGVNSKQTGIFVVDEPELSLHLSWQRIFVEKTMQINPNIQLVFATHSPEFVGRYRNKMYKLEKKYSI